MKSKKVFFQLVDTLSMGGTERMSVNMAAAMLEEGWESHLVVSRRGGGMEAHLNPGIQVHYLNKTAFYDIFAFVKLTRLVTKYQPSVFHAHSTSIFWAVFLKMLAGRFLLVWHDHFGLSDQLELHPRKEMVLMAKWIDRIVTVNDKLLHYWQNLIPYKAQNFRTIGNFPYLALAPSIKYSRFTFLNLANFRKQKDQLNLIRAGKILMEKGHDFQILLVGELVEKEWVTSVNELISELSLDHHVTVSGPSNQVSDLLASSHAGVLSSESEGLPVSLLEYGLAALPVVTTRVGDCDKVISSREFGWLVPPKSPELLAAAMEEMFLNPEESTKTGRALKQKVEREFGKEAFLKNYLDLLEIEKA